MSKDEAWKKCEDAFFSVCNDRCIDFDCGCKEFVEKIREAIYV
jgi:hypothetical protein